MTVLAPDAPPTDPEPGALNQPWRGLVALGEVLLAAAAVVVGVLCWHRGIVSIETPTQHGPPVASTVVYGNWAAAGIGLVVLAAILVLDAIRQTLLAVRTRQRPAPTLPPDDEPEPEATPEPKHEPTEAAEQDDPQ